MASAETKKKQASKKSKSLKKKTAKKVATKKKAKRASKTRPKKSASSTTTENGSQSTYVPIDNLIVNEKFQIREVQKPVAPLAKDVKKNGLLMPILVRPASDGHFEIICGHRRYEALKSSKRKEAYIVIRTDLDNDDDAMRFTIAENIQREDLNHLDLAMLCLRLQKDEGKSVREIAQLVFPKQGGQTADRTVQNYLTVAKTNPLVRDALGRERISFTIAILLANCLKKKESEIDFTSEKLAEIIDEIAAKGMSVSQCKELLAQLDQGTAPSRRKRERNTDPAIFKEGKDGNWALRVNFNAAKCDNDLDLASKIKASLELALNSVNDFLKARTPTH